MSNIEETSDPTTSHGANTEDKLPTDSAGNIKAVDYSTTENGGVDKDKNLDFGDMLLTEYETSESISNTYGDDARLGSKESYWDNDDIRQGFINNYGEENAEKNFDMVYKNLEGEYSKYRQGNFEADTLMDNMVKVSYSGNVNENARAIPVVKSVMKTMDGSIQYGDKYLGAQRSDREAMTQKVRLITGTDAQGNPQFELFDLTDDVKSQLEEAEGFDGFAYNNLQRAQGKHSRGVGFVDVITNGEVWDDLANNKVDVRNDQIVSNWDIDDGSVMHSLLKGNGLEMQGIDYAKILVRSPLNTAIEFLDIIPQVGRGILGVAMGSDAKSNSMYRSLTSMGIQLKGYKTSMSDEAQEDGFFGSAEVFLSTTADVASQLLLAGGMGKLVAKGAGMYAKGLGSAGATMAAARATAGIGSAVGNTTRLALTMMAAKDMYQEALEHGFTERESGLAMGAAVWAMWKANSFSGYLTEGIEPSATKLYSKKLANKLMDDAAGAIKKGYVKSITAEGWMSRMSKANKTLGNMLKFAKEKMQTDMNWHAAMSEASEEIFEELSTEGVRQMMNGYQALRGNDLMQMAVGKGRFKSYFDHGYWDELGQQLLVSGIAGGIGGVIGKTLHGGANLTGLTDTSTMLDFILAGKGAELTAQINQAAKNNVYGPEGMTTQRDDVTGAFMSGEHKGKTMNATMKDALLQDMVVLQTFVDETGLDSAKRLIDGDPTLKANINNTSILKDVKEYSTDLRALLDKTGVGVKTLSALEDSDVQESLVLANNESAKYRNKLNTEVEEYKVELQKLTDLKSTLDAQDAEQQADVVDGEETTKKEEKAPSFTPEQQMQMDDMNTKIAEQKKQLDIMDETVSRQDLEAIQELVIKTRGLKNGSAAETYYMQHTFHTDPMFGSMQNRDAEYIKYGENFFQNTLKNARSTMSKLNKKQVNIVKKGQDNDRLLKGLTSENLDKFESMFDNRPPMSSESFQKLLDTREEIKASGEMVVAVKEYFNSPQFIDASINAAVAPFSDAEFIDASADESTNDEKVVDILHQPGKAVWAMSATGKTTLAAKGNHIDFDEYINSPGINGTPIAMDIASALAAGDKVNAEKLLISTWEKALAESAEAGKTLIGSGSEIMRLATEGKITLDAAIGTDSGETFFKRKESAGVSDVAKIGMDFNDTLSSLNSFKGNILYTDKFLGELTPEKKLKVEDKNLVDKKHGVSKKLLGFVKGEQFKRIYTKLIKEYTTQVNVAEELLLPAIVLTDDVTETFNDIIESDTFTNSDEDFYALFDYDADVPIEISQGYNVFNASADSIVSLASAQMVTDALRATPQAQNLQRQYQDVLNSDDRLQKIDKFIGSVTDPNVSSKEREVFNQANIDPQIPSIYSPFQLDWMHMELSGGIGQEFVTSDSNMLRKVAEISNNLKVSPEGDAYELNDTAREALKQTKDSIQIRQHQRDLLQHLMSAPPLPTMVSPLERIASFRDNIYKILEDKSFPLSPRFSQEEQHNYKNHSIVSDFINDFIYDPRVLLDIEKRYVAQEPISKKEEDLYVQYKQFIGNLKPITTDEKLKEGTDEAIVDMQRDILDMQGVRKGVDFMSKTGSLEQGLELLNGIEFLLDEFPPADVAGGVESRKYLKKRQDSLQATFKQNKQFITGFIYNYEGIAEEAPDTLIELNEAALAWKPEDTVTDDDYIALEKLIHKFYKVLPQVKEDLGDTFYQYFGNNGRKNPALKLFSIYDIDNFYKHYLSYLENAMSSDGQVPLYEQEMNAAFINAFINSEGEVHSTKRTFNGFDSSMLLAISGVAGGGKTHVVAKLGLDIAQRQQAELYGDNKTKVMIASNYDTQIGNLKKSLDTAGVKLSGEGKTFDKLIGTLKDYISGDGGPSVKAEIESTSVILYDEYSGINAKLAEHLAPGEESIHSLVDLVRHVNKLKPEGSPEIKLVVLGDKEQTEYTDDTGIESDFAGYINGNAHLAGINMDVNFRSSNTYLSEALKKMHKGAGAFEEFIANVKHDEYAQVYFASQEKFGGKLMGMQSVTKSFAEMMEDELLALNIENQIKLAKEEGKNFTVGIIADNIEVLPMQSPVGKLITKYAESFTVSSSEEIVRRVSTKKVQGLEFNYVLTEFSLDYIGDPAVMTEDDNLYKKQYTLASRAKDFVMIANNNNAKIVSTKTNEQLIVLDDDSTKINKQLTYDHISKVFADIAPTARKTTPDGADISVDVEADVETGTEVDLAAEVSTSVTEFIKQHELALLKEFKDYKEPKDLIRTFRLVYNLSPAERINVFNYNDVPPEMSEEGAKWVADNKTQLKRILTEINEAIKKEEKRVAGVIDDAILTMNPQYGPILLGDVTEFTERVKAEIISSHPDVNLTAKFTDDTLKDRIKTHIEVANSEDTVEEEVETKEEDTSDSHSNNTELDPTKNQVKKDYKEKIIDYGSFQAMRDRADELGEKIVTNKASAEEIKEFNELMRSIEQFFKQGIAPQPKITHDYSPKSEEDIDSELQIESENIKSIPGIFDQEMFNMRKNQPINGSNIQLLNIRDKKLKSTKEIATLAGYNDILTSQNDIHEALHYGEKLKKVEFIGGKDSEGYNVGLMIAVTGEGKNVVLGRMVLGFPARVGPDKTRESVTNHLRNNADMINDNVGLTGDNKITATSTDEELESKLYPTNYALKMKIEYSEGIVRQAIPVSKVKNLISVGAGNLNRSGDRKTKIPFNKIMADEKGNIDSNISVSPHIIINKGEYFKGVGKGRAFVLYTTNPYIDLKNLQTVMDLLETRDAKTGALSMRNRSKVKTDIGILPLDSADTTLEAIYNQSTSKNLTAKNTKLTQHLVFNDMLTGTKTNSRIAKLMAELSVYMLQRPDLSTALMPSEVKAAQAAEGKAANFDTDTTNQLIAGIERVRYIKPGQDLEFTLEHSAKEIFFNNLTPKKGSVLTKEDILASIFTPYIRNTRSPQEDKAFAGEASLYSMLQGKEYGASTTAMFGESIDAAGNVVQNFNSVDMLAATANEIRTRLADKGVKGDELESQVKMYMDDIILPMLSDAFAKSKYFSKKSIVINKETATEGAYVTTNGVVFETSAVGETGYLKNGQGDAVAATARFRPGKDNSANGVFVGANILGIKYPHVKFNGAALVAALGIPKPPPGGVRPGALVDVSKGIMKNFNAAYDKIEANIDAASTAEDVQRIEAEVHVQTLYLGEVTDPDTGTTRWESLTEANRVSINKRTAEVQNRLNASKKRLAKKDDVVEIHTIPFASEVNVKTLKDNKMPFDTMVAHINAARIKAIDTVNNAVTDKGTKVEILDQISMSADKALADVETERNIMATILTDGAKNLQKISNEAVTYSEADKNKAIVSIGYLKQKVNTIKAFLNTQAIETMISATEAKLNTSDSMVLYIDPKITAFSISPEGEVINMEVPVSDTKVKIFKLSKDSIIDENDVAVTLKDMGKFMTLETFDMLRVWQGLAASTDGSFTQERVDVLNELKKTLTGATDNAPVDFKEIKPPQRKVIDIKDIFITFNSMKTGDGQLLSKSLNSLPNLVMNDVVSALTGIKAGDKSVANFNRLRPLLAKFSADMGPGLVLKSIMNNIQNELKNC